MKKKQYKNTGRFVVVIQFPAQVSKPMSNTDAQKLKTEMSKKLPARTGRKITIAKA